jgi:predicted GIY-YIG superfamily endonuclease
MWYEYFLELSDGDIYVGSTPDLRRRFHSHQNGHVTSTQRHRPLKLKAYVTVETEEIARDLERYFKSGSGKAIALNGDCRRRPQSGRRPAGSGQTAFAALPPRQQKGGKRGIHTRVSIAIRKPEPGGFSPPRFSLPGPSTRLA